MTEWVTWFIHQVQASCEEASKAIDDTLAKARFWITRTSRATASRELIELEALELLMRVGAGRSTRYYAKLPGWGPGGPA